MSLLNQRITDRRNNPYTNLKDEFYTSKVNYYYAEVDYTFQEVDLEISYLLLMESIYRIASVGSLAAYSEDNLYLQSFEYNMKNEIVGPSRTKLHSFIESMHEQAYKEKDKAGTISFICIGIYLGIAVLQFVFVVFENLSIFSQAELMLLLPTRNCKEQEKTAKEFLTIIHLGNFDMEQMSDDHVSYNSGTNSVQSGRRKKSYSVAVSMRNMEGRRFVCSAFRKLGYIWRSFVFLCLLGGYLLILQLLVYSHFNKTIEISNSFEITVMSTNYINGVQNAIMNYYITPDWQIGNMDPYDYIQMRLDDLLKDTSYLLDVPLPLKVECPQHDEADVQVE
eukprot:TRINITY_DN10843_c0_g1_i3.p1 TRINITY_DN10843_c0_g1~~TRINITY_DN10843_c0_g1_i3.p1  ORF type:complete len:336 (+),score=79.24 TRINITY_DN10843_c0_g1_i3:631-1638(+)